MVNCPSPPRSVVPPHTAGLSPAVCGRGGEPRATCPGLQPIDPRGLARGRLAREICHAVRRGKVATGPARWATPSPLLGESHPATAKVTRDGGGRDSTYRRGNPCSGKLSAGQWPGDSLALNGAVGLLEPLVFFFQSQSLLAQLNLSFCCFRQSNIIFFIVVSITYNYTVKSEQCLSYLLSGLMFS